MKRAETRVRGRINLGSIPEAQRGTLLLWAPFALAIGVGGYFSLTFEPSIRHYVYVAAVAATVAAALRVTSVHLVSFSIWVGLIALGFSLAGASAHRKSAPVLGFHFYGAVEGRIIAIDRSNTDHSRITLDQLVLERVPVWKTPETVRISLLFAAPFVTPQPGQRVILTANLSPPDGPVEPGGFDFQRFAWFAGLGAVGYARLPMLEIAPPDKSGWKMTVFLLRIYLSEGIKARLAGQKGAFAAAILTGDRSGVGPEVMADLRASNLAHLLAISGLHMGLLTGFVFAAIRYGLALVPPVALRVPGKKIAALCAFLAAVAYLILSGGNIATQRAFIMVSVMLLAVMLDRRALTLRAVALAAVIVLIMRPESLIEAGFQMSFAATTALVGVFAAMRDWQIMRPAPGRGRKFARGVATLVISSAVAGAATAPISAYHFNQVAQFGLLANLASVPVMGFLIMPAAVTAIIAAPFGLDWPFWAVMGAGIDWILYIANQIGSLEFAVHRIAKPDGAVLPLIAAGFLILVILRTPIRAVGLVPVILGFFMWSQSTRPDLLVSANGRVLGLQTPLGRVVNRARGNGFVVRSWLENDGDGADQITSAARLGLIEHQKVARLSLAETNVAYRWGKSIAPADISQLCGQNALVIAPQFSGPINAPCTLVNLASLRDTGALAIRPGENGLEITGAYQITGTRLWTRHPRQ